ncbi:hypothetical protein L1887_27866 [Cichorium endivia]|nr:hypothetical protein L1887_27866 [Cichorium endivia]
MKEIVSVLETALKYQVSNASVSTYKHWQQHEVKPGYGKLKLEKVEEVKNPDQPQPKDVPRGIKRHDCFDLVKRVPLFMNMDEMLLNNICRRLKPRLYTCNSYIIREGHPVDGMLFIIRGRLESATTDNFINTGFLKEGDYCGEELLTWVDDPHSNVDLPSSSRTLKALTEVETFVLPANQLKCFVCHFTRIHQTTHPKIHWRQLHHTFQFYSWQWWTWAACFIQAAWRDIPRGRF